MTEALPVMFAAILLVMCIQVALLDVRHRRIPNALLLGYLAVFTLLKLLASWTDAAAGADWEAALLGFTAALLVFYPVWRWRWIGAADVKLMAVLGFALGWRHGLLVVLAGTVLTGAHALLLVWRPALEQKYGFALPGQHVRARSLPYGAWLAVATLVWMVWQG